MVATRTRTAQTRTTSKRVKPRRRVRASMASRPAGPRRVGGSRPPRHQRSLRLEVTDDLAGLRRGVNAGLEAVVELAVHVVGEHVAPGVENLFPRAKGGAAVGLLLAQLLERLRVLLVVDVKRLDQVGEGVGVDLGALVLRPFVLLDHVVAADAGEHHDDGDDDEHFEQREAGAGAAHGLSGGGAAVGVENHLWYLGKRAGLSSIIYHLGHERTMSLGGSRIQGPTVREGAASTAEAIAPSLTVRPWNDESREARDRLALAQRLLHLLELVEIPLP